MPVDILPGGERRTWSLDAPTNGAGPVERTATVVPILPCGGCAHVPVCAVKPLLSAEAFTVRPIASPHPAVRLRMSVEVTCDHYLPGVEPPQVVTPEAQSRRNGTAASLVARGKDPAKTPRRGRSARDREKAERSALVMEAMERLGGDVAKVAAELGMRPNIVAIVAKHSRGASA